MAVISYATDYKVSRDWKKVPLECCVYLGSLNAVSESDMNRDPERNDFCPCGIFNKSSVHWDLRIKVSSQRYEAGLI